MFFKVYGLWNKISKVKAEIILRTCAWSISILRVFSSPSIIVEHAIAFFAVWRKRVFALAS
jgi:hypothetical protein